MSKEKILALFEKARTKEESTLTFSDTAPRRSPDHYVVTLRGGAKSYYVYTITGDLRTIRMEIRHEARCGKI